MSDFILPRIGGGGDDYPQQTQMVELDPGSVWASAPMLGLYGTAILAAVPIVVLWLKKRWKMREG